MGRPGFRARPARRTPPGDQLLPAGAGLGRELKLSLARMMLAVCWPGPAMPAGPPLTCRPPSRPGGRPCRPSMTWDGRTSWGRRQARASRPVGLIVRLAYGGRHWPMTRRAGAMARGRGGRSYAWPASCWRPPWTPGFRQDTARGQLARAERAWSRLAPCRFPPRPAPGARQAPVAAWPGRRAAGYRVPVTCHDTVSTPSQHQALAW